ncbi:MAG: Vms1/Ankzf1 family peptidyl-tRNA hydrolase [Candidatus Syntropharchaeia archaeon]
MKKVISDKQVVDTALKRAEKRIEALEQELENLENREPDEPSFKKSITLTSTQTRNLLFKIGSIRSKNEDLLTIYLTRDESIENLDIDVDGSVKYLMKKIKSPTGMALFHDTNPIGGISLIVTPPFPISESGWRIDRAFDTARVEKMLDSKMVGIVLAHAGETFIGIANENSFIDHRIVRSRVKEKHSKGGWSQRRFERLREEEIKKHIRKAKNAFEEFMDEHGGEIEIIVAGGEQNMVRDIVKEFNHPIIFRSIDARIERDIERIRIAVWSSRWYELL